MFKKRNKKPITESELIRLSKINHSHFGALYEKYFEPIFRFVFRRLGGNEAESNDLTQQTFIKALLNIEKYEDRGMPFSSWLYRIAQNEVNLFFRASKKEYSVDVEERHLTAILEELDGGSRISIEEQEKLIQLINSLDPEQSDLIELRFFQEMSFKEIASIYTITEANAKMKIYRILEKMNLKWKQST